MLVSPHLQPSLIVERLTTGIGSEYPTRQAGGFPSVSTLAFSAIFWSCSPKKVLKEFVFHIQERSRCSFGKQEAVLLVGSKAGRNKKDRKNDRGNTGEGI